MPEQAVLIAALSARALSQSAARAGYRPLVVDCFGDQDLASAPSDTRVSPATVRQGFSSKALRQALRDLAEECDAPIIGLILGAGFEDRPKLMQKLARDFGLLGIDPDIASAVKDPDVFFPLLTKLSIAYPETQSDPPTDARGWLRKRIGASGGLHVKPCDRLTTKQRKAPHTRYYFQKRFSGDVISALAIVGKNETALALSQQWTAPTRHAPFRYGGAVSNPRLPQDIETTVLEAATTLCRAIQLRGMVGIDFLVNTDGVFCLEINPRPGAAIDVHEDGGGALFEAHMIACANGDPITHLRQHWAAPPAKASAYLYADDGPLTMGKIAWPDWASDRQRAGTQVGAHQPLASVQAVAETADEARKICTDRLAALNKLLYDGQIGKETRL